MMSVSHPNSHFPITATNNPPASLIFKFQPKLLNSTLSSFSALLIVSQLSVMALFPEEPLNLSAADGYGYFPADINQTLNGGEFTIVRKLGWGPRSSTWLVQAKDEDGTDRDNYEDGDYQYWAVQAFTVAKSKEVESRLLPIVENELSRTDDEIHFPNYSDSFWEKSVHGEHLCFVMDVYGLPFSHVVQAAGNSGRAGLPVHVVQYASSVILEQLPVLHAEKVMHASVELKSIVFDVARGRGALMKHIASTPPAKTQIIDGLPVVRSQPISNYKVKWYEPMSDVSQWMLRLSGFGYVQVPPYAPERELDYGSAPETLLENPTCGLATDIWMLGCLVFQLLTGKQLFTSTGTGAERLGEIRDVLQGIIPDTWQADGHVQAIPDANGSTRTLEQRLKEVLTEDEASAANAFLRKCLVIDPAGRKSAKDLELRDGWVKEGSKCSCCYR
ncbi:CMGC/SRPK protein kinase [Ephemerocybe angulata]|uniref:non-specific serine/threonine protein kinase n=1 Tax=Ephemerocybe angulata TaxID=980116 RepID=A0A8H6I692_9AGAR|nr:CMGC/SRPK protein kinase [Tulosesus angulatus]